MQVRAVVIGMLLVGCANDPMYLPSPTNMEAGQDDGMGGTVQAKSSLVLPIKPESMKDATDRAALATKLGLTMMDVPYVRVGDLDLEVEWSIKNLDNVPGQAKIELNGANEWFVYDPSMIVLSPGDDEAPPTPGLAGDQPIDVPAGGEVQGLFREDQLLEASIDLDSITRGNVNPFAATLTVEKNADSFQPMSPPMLTNPVCQQNPADPTCAQTPTGPAIPRAAFAQIIRVDLVFKPDHHMVLDYTVRVRDHRGILHDMGLSAPASEVVAFAPAIYMP